MTQDQIQNEAVDAWEDAGFIGTLNLGVGAGKTFCFFKALYRLQELGLLTSDDLVVFKAERSNRWENTVVPEADKFESIFGKNPVKDFKIDFYTYQSNVYKEAKFIVYDEIHDCLTSSRYEQVSKPTCYKLGLTGTPNENLYIFPDRAVPKLFMSSTDIENKKITDQLTKGGLFQMFCPIVYTKTEEELIDLDVLSPFETVIIWHELDERVKNYEITKTWKVSEKEWWEKRKSYAQKLFAQAYSIDDPNDRTRKGLIFQASQILKVRMSKFLYTLKSKVPVTKKLLSHITTPTILFSVEKELLWEFTDNVVDTKKDATQLVSKFNSGEINVIATSKALQQGVTLTGLQNIILVTFQSSSGQLIQTIGRVIRKVKGKVGRLYIIVAKDTYEEKWLTEMQKVKDAKGKKSRTVKLNVIAEINSNEITKENLRL
jgi:superfamily II DNA or RNA helicase